MIHPEIRRELLKSLGITPQALSQRAQRLNEKYGPMPLDDAKYVIAHQTGIDLSKHLPLESLDRIRALVPRPSFSASGLGRKVRASKTTKPKARKTKAQKQSYPLVKSKDIEGAATIGQDLYPRVFMLENSIRELIRTTLSPQGSNWWDTHVPKSVQKRVEWTKKKEAQYPYRGPRGKDNLEYCNWSDLKDIIVDNNNQSLFAGSIVNFPQFEAKMDEVYMARNNLAHSVPLSADDINRISQFHRDWARWLEAAGIK